MNLSGSERRSIDQQIQDAQDRLNKLKGVDDVTAPRRHRCAKVGLRGSTERSGHVGDYHGWARPGPLVSLRAVGSGRAGLPRYRP